MGAIAAGLQGSSAQDWMSRLVPLGVVAAEVGTLEHALTSEQTRARNMVVENRGSGRDDPRDRQSREDRRGRGVPAAAAARRAPRPPFTGRDAMSLPTSQQRRSMSKAPIRAANASVADVLPTAQGSAGLCCRVGVAGPGRRRQEQPDRSARRRHLQREGDIAILAIGPTSPVSGGAIVARRVSEVPEKLPARAPRAARLALRDGGASPAAPRMTKAQPT